MISKSNGAFFKIFVLFLALSLTLSTFSITVNASAAPKVVKIENSDPFTVTVNDKNVKNSINSIPLFNQMDYPGVDFGNGGTIASYGCGLVCMAMVATYLMDEFQDPVVLAERFAKYTNDDGSLLIMFARAAEEMGLLMDLSNHPNKEWDDQLEWDRVLAAIKNDQPVIALYRGKESLFTDTGHFIVITGMTEDGKFMVNDPNGWNWGKPELIDGYTNGFTEKQILLNAVSFWIYSTKEEYKKSLDNKILVDNT